MWGIGAVDRRVVHVMRATAHMRDTEYKSKRWVTKLAQLNCSHDSAPMTFPVSLILNIPFESNKQALIAEKTLSPDPILKPGQSQITYSVHDTTLHIDVQAVDDRVVRVTVNNLMENLKTVIECFEEFDTTTA